MGLAVGMLEGVWLGAGEGESSWVLGMSVKTLRSVGLSIEGVSVEVEGAFPCVDRAVHAPRLSEIPSRKVIVHR
jgi:hypothetical protein